MLIFLSIPSPLVRVQLKACRISLGVLFRFTPSLFFDLLNGQSLGDTEKWEPVKKK